MIIYNNKSKKKSEIIYTFKLFLYNDKRIGYESWDGSRAEASIKLNT